MMPSANSPIKTTAAAAIKRMKISGLKNCEMKMEKIPGTFGSGNSLGPNSIRRAFASSAVKPASPVSSLSNSFGRGSFFEIEPIISFRPIP